MNIFLNVYKIKSEVLLYVLKWFQHFYVVFLKRICNIKFLLASLDTLTLQRNNT
jgi:hypothetical protein